MLAKIDRALGKLEVILASVILAAITVVVFLQVLYRYVFWSPLAWTDELSRYLQVWLTFIGASIAIQRSAHFHLDIVHHIIPRRFHNILGFFVDAALLVFVALLAVNGAALLEIVSRQVSPAMNLNMAYAYMGIPVGCAFMAVHLIIRLIQRLSPAYHADAKGGISQ